MIDLRLHSNLHRFMSLRFINILPRNCHLLHLKQYFRLRIYKGMKYTNYIVVPIKEIKWNLKWDLFVYFGRAGYRIQGLMHVGKFFFWANTPSLWFLLKLSCRNWELQSVSLRNRRRTGITQGGNNRWFCIQNGYAEEKSPVSDF